MTIFSNNFLFCIKNIENIDKSIILKLHFDLILNINVCKDLICNVQTTLNLYSSTPNNSNIPLPLLT